MAYSSYTGGIPNRQDPTNFSDYMDAWVAWFTENAAALASQMGSIVFADATGGADEWVSGASYTAGDAVYSTVDWQTYRAKTTHSGQATDPSSDTTRWKRVTLVAQSSADDDTENVALLPGAFGLGGALIEFSGDIDDTAQMPTGFYRVVSGATGTKPPSLTAFNMLVERRAPAASYGTTTQTAKSGRQIWYREWDGSTWKDWWTYSIIGGEASFATLKPTELQETAQSISGTTPSIDLETGTYFYITTSGNTTFSFTNPAAAGTVSQFTLEVTAGGTHTLSWPAAVDTPNGAGLETPASGEKFTYVFTTRDGGATWLGYVAGRAMA